MGQHPVNAPLFNPAESEMGRRAAKHSHYDRNSYCRCIARACKKAGVPHWSPHQLRHTNATAIRQEFGIEAAQVVLGHCSSGTTEIYAERDLGLVIEVMKKLG